MVSARHRQRIDASASKPTLDSRSAVRQSSQAQSVRTEFESASSHHWSENSPQNNSGGWRKGVQRPPWTNETAVRAHCTSCRACIEVCPEGILFEGPAGTPMLDFNAGGMYFLRVLRRGLRAAGFSRHSTSPLESFRSSERSLPADERGFVSKLYRCLRRRCFAL